MEELKFSVYRHTNLINGKVYIGITSQIPEKRWGKNGKNYTESIKFNNAINANQEAINEALIKIGGD